jgi:hypothetical protein
MTSFGLTTSQFPIVPAWRMDRIKSVLVYISKGLSNVKDIHGQHHGGVEARLPRPAPRNKNKNPCGCVNYFPLEAMQKFDASATLEVIENGMYGPWDIPHVWFAGGLRLQCTQVGNWSSISTRSRYSDFLRSGWGGKRSRRLLARRDWVAQTTRSSWIQRRAFFNRTIAYDEIATARGGKGWFGAVEPGRQLVLL